MVNGISEKGLSVNQKVNIVNFLGGTSKDSRETGWHNQGTAGRFHISCWN